MAYSRASFQLHSRRGRLHSSRKLFSIAIYLILLIAFFLFTVALISRKGLEEDDGEAHKQISSSVEEFQSERQAIQCQRQATLKHGEVLYTDFRAEVEVSFGSGRLFFSVAAVVQFVVLIITGRILEDDGLLLKSEKKSLDQQLWEAPFSFGLQPCAKPTAKHKVSASGAFDRYLTVRCNGGLNQMRTGIADIVAVAHIMNATLVIPQLDRKSFWKDSSQFVDIFDEDHFIESLQGDVRVVKELPEELQSIPHARKHFQSWSSKGYYEEMTQLFDEYQVVHIPKSDSRLANNDLPLDIQRLRCRALYHSLRFSPSIETLGKKLVERLRSRGGKYIALHLRYEKDMLAFTGCTYGLTKAEAEELKIMRESTSHWKVKKINSTEQRNAGLCPLTPKEVGIFLQALGYPSSTLIYIAAGEIFGGSTRLLDLSSRFPNLVFKETLASEEELSAFAEHASQTAALDYIISVESDVFVPTHSGNMARAVEGHRRFLGHRKTITPDRKGLVEVFDKLEFEEVMEGPSFSQIVQRMHEQRQGGPRKRRASAPGVKGRARFRTEESFYENPYPECICADSKRQRTY